MDTRSLAIADPFDLAATTRALGVGLTDVDGVWWWATDPGSGPTTIAIERTEGGVLASAWGPGADVVLGRLPVYVGADDVWDDQLLAGPADRFVRERRGLRLGATLDIHAALVKGVLGQQVTTKEAKRSARLLRNALGSEAPGPHPGLRTPPPPDVLSTTTYEDLHRFGIERKRASTLIEVSRRHKRLAEILTFDVEAAEERLLAVRGVGPWTTAIVMGTAVGDRDAVTVGDYHLPNLISWALAGEDRGDDTRMLELLEPYRPQRRRVVVSIKQSGIHAPRYGPRTAVRRHL
ncbi:MAG: DNA-3-methyladenine glycosylase family protein [Acidimicrobiia bacterium]